MREVIGSYEIEFIGSERVASILVEALKTDSRRVRLEKTDKGFILKINGGGKRITIDCIGNCGGSGEIRIVNSRKLPNGKVKTINAYTIAEKLNSIPEMALLGALAKLGIVDLGKLMAAIYKNFDGCTAHSHAIAAKRGFESF